MQDPNFFEEVQLIDVREPEEVYVLIFHFSFFYFYETKLDN